MADAPRDNNQVTALLAIDDTDGSLQPVLTDAAGNILIAATVAGGVMGPGSSTDNAIARWDGITGELLQDSGITISDANVMLIPSLTASQAVVTDGSKNLSSLAYGTASAATSLVERDANQNAFANNFVSKATNVVSAGGTTTLTAASTRVQTLTGSSTQIFALPDATTLSIGSIFEFDNNSTGNLTVNNAGGSLIATVVPGGYAKVKATAVSTSNGAWNTHFFIPENGVWGTAGAIITGTLSVSGEIAPVANDGAPLGDTTHNFSDLFLASGAVVNFANSNVVLTHSSGILTLGTGTLKITTPTNTTPSVVTIDGTQSLTNKTLNGMTVSSSTGTFTLTNSKTFAVTNSLTLSGTDSTTMTFPSTTAVIARTDAAQTFTGTQTFSQIVTTNNAITASGNAATVPISSRLSTVTNNSAATLTITITTTSAVDGQMVMVRVLDFSAAAQTITWVNTENSTVTAPTTSNGSTTLPLTVGFQYNNATSKWRCIASA